MPFNFPTNNLYNIQAQKIQDEAKAKSDLSHLAIIQQAKLKEQAQGKALRAQHINKWDIF